MTHQLLAAAAMTGNLDGVKKFLETIIAIGILAVVASIIYGIVTGKRTSHAIEKAIGVLIALVVLALTNDATRTAVSDFLSTTLFS